MNTKDLKSFWDTSKNGDIPDRIGRHERVWWRCPSGHSWAENVESFNGCPVCNKRERFGVTRGIDDIVSKCPEAVLDWVDDKDPREVKYNSRKNYKWKCHICGEEYLDSPYNRILNNRHICKIAYDIRSSC